MKPILAKLALVRPNEDHDHPSYGAYTMDALQKGLQKRRKQLWFLNVKARFKRRARGPASVIRSRRPAHLVIGRRPGQLPGTWHCITRALVGDKFVFIDSDNYHYFPNREDLLTNFFETFDGVYAVEDRSIPQNLRPPIFSDVYQKMVHKDWKSEEGGNEQVDAGASGGRVQCADWQDGKRAVAGRWLAGGRTATGRQKGRSREGREDGRREGGRQWGSKTAENEWDGPQHSESRLGPCGGSGPSGHGTGTWPLEP
ncbi:hypothetical protein PPTG_22897 [Phytophthora nicotianae INRA-310]|uniref:Uncharacterized protein n=1 Tax=Phytophthora nicotianae (strain INRA-310) TaxID=761204 RepID=W2QBH2_PHYN3|nr:hypothetical protein PPTG_22897 [Phytophthora nicotianae INRA-310]ETN09615.1 hypothetical protein PPTG_22897 [Phytophthora nicotianae INRA-310]